MVRDVAKIRLDGWARPYPKLPRSADSYSGAVLDDTRPLGAEPALGRAGSAAASKCVVAASAGGRTYAHGATTR